MIGIGISPVEEERRDVHSGLHMAVERSSLNNSRLTIH